MMFKLLLFSSFIIFYYYCTSHIFVLAKIMESKKKLIVSRIIFVIATDLNSFSYYIFVKNDIQLNSHWNVEWLVLCADFLWHTHLNFFCCSLDFFNSTIIFKNFFHRFLLVLTRTNNKKGTRSTMKYRRQWNPKIKCFLTKNKKKDILLARPIYLVRLNECLLNDKK